MKIDGRMGGGINKWRDICMGGYLDEEWMD
jgi:hypothetical protein